MIEKIKTSKLSLESIDGQQFMAASNSFELFHNCNNIFTAKQKGKPSEYCELVVYKLNATLKAPEIFKAFGVNLNRLCLSESQVLCFCEKYPEELTSDGLATFFLVKKGNKYFIFDIHKGENKILVVISDMRTARVWQKKRGYRIIIKKYEED